MRRASPLLDRIRQTVEQFDMFRPGMAVGVAVSGGADSVCLLHLLREFDLRLHVLHLNHHLRGDESTADAEFVRQMAAQLGLPFTLGEAIFDRASGNLEQAAREARMAFFRDAIACGMVERVALGHTRSDQAETVLFRFLRGSGTAGLSGIRPVTGDGIVRPLIDIDRAEIECFLQSRGIPWRQDSTNTDRRFARNRIRHDLLPQLERDWNPAIRDSLVHIADWAQAEESYWQAELDRLSPGILREQHGFIFVETALLNAQPVAVARRLARRAIQQVKGNLRGIEFRHIAAILEMASRPTGHGRLQVPGLQVIRSFDWLRLGIPRPHSAGYHLPAPIPGNLPIPGTGLSISLELIEKPETFAVSDCVYNEGMVGLDWPRLSGSSLALRNWQPGDRYQPSGSTGEKKVKALFQQARVPIWERRLWPVLLDGDSIVWVRRFGPAAQVAADSGSRSILRILEVEAN